MATRSVKELMTTLWCESPEVTKGVAVGSQHLAGVQDGPGGSAQRKQLFVASQGSCIRGGPRTEEEGSGPSQDGGS